MGEERRIGILRAGILPLVFLSSGSFLLKGSLREMIIFSRQFTRSILRRSGCGWKMAFKVESNSTNVLKPFRFSPPCTPSVSYACAEWQGKDGFIYVKDSYVGEKKFRLVVCSLQGFGGINE